MFIVNDYSLAVVFCIITMLCWGSWGNTQKLAGKTWRFELFYWDYVIGILLFSIISAFTLGSNGSEGRSFINDLQQADSGNLLSAFIGGIIFNAANILFSAAIAIAGMSVAFPVAIGLALVLGVLVNYFAAQKGDATLLFAGITLVAIAIILNAIAYRKKSAGEKTVSGKGILISLVAGITYVFLLPLYCCKYGPGEFSIACTGKMTPYTAVFIFSVGIFISNFLFNTILIKRPFVGEPTSYAAYFRGKFSTHLTGILGGLIWGLGNSFNLIAAGKQDLLFLMDWDKALR